MNTRSHDPAGASIAQLSPVLAVTAIVRNGMNGCADEGATDTELMQAHPGVAAKGGAEGLICASGRGMGLALKVADGNPRAQRPALAAFAQQLGVPLPEFEEVPVPNRHGDAAATVSIL